MTLVARLTRAIGPWWMRVTELVGSSAGSRNRHRAHCLSSSGSTWVMRLATCVDRVCILNEVATPAKNSAAAQDRWHARPNTSSHASFRAGEAACTIVRRFGRLVLVALTDLLRRRSDDGEEAGAHSVE